MLRLALQTRSHARPDRVGRALALVPFALLLPFIKLATVTPKRRATASATSSWAFRSRVLAARCRSSDALADDDSDPSLKTLAEAIPIYLGEEASQFLTLTDTISTATGDLKRQPHAGLAPKVCDFWQSLPAEHRRPSPTWT